MAEFERERARMVDEQLAGRDIDDPRVLAAMRSVPRHRFVTPRQAAAAYEDHPLPIGNGQTISQPYIVALMCQAARVRAGDRVLEIGTGSGYAAAVLGELAAEVHTVERHSELARAATRALQPWPNVHVHEGDGTLGLPECAPFDAVLVTAAGPDVPEPLVEQLGEGGRLVIPVGEPRFGQQLIRLTLQGDELLRDRLMPVVFVPLIGRHGTAP
ncbi:protein-L-isoaspartate(D-aspartate) O-methyltransferase [Ruicaihuangia caeni]|uniref:Protein-L-isoaspartate O-methyltransferase n=1 Tax=Ruicaihuangia caeni TaxID=3042517 RepID=A0AAW6T5W0_9MICO|nr:protein-L-isoaspartate(D-aspartate) O-methyltransferase [Klugiella sp. YN-L-19]MDI2097753.1 protein-L-isoaspartate(D-aspartate) O-methyltransferase [Klugiella sp. YN-L-19]